MSDVQARVAEALAEHVFREIEPACSCGWDCRESVLPSRVGFVRNHPKYPHNERPRQHRAHVAAVLAEAGLLAKPCPGPHLVPAPADDSKEW